MVAASRNAVLVVALVLLVAFGLMIVLGIQDVFESPEAMRGVLFGLIGSSALCLLATILVRRNPGRRLRSALGLGLVAGASSYVLATVGMMALGDYGLMAWSTGPLLPGVWGAVVGLIALGPAVIYVVFNDRPHPLVVAASVAAVYLTQFGLVAAVLLTGVAFWRRADLARIP